MIDRNKILRIAKWSCAVLAVASLGIGIYCKNNDNDVTDEYQATIEEYTHPQEEVVVESESSQASPDPPTQESKPQPYVIGADFNALKARNSDVVAWLSIPDTSIAYPVVQGENNTEYLHTGWTGEYRSSGSAFLDAREDLKTADNYIVYGHAMSSYSRLMFSPLLKYKNQSYYQQHQYLYMSYADNPIGSIQSIDGNYQDAGQYRYHIFAVCQVDSGNDADIGTFYNFQFDDQEQMDDYVKSVQNRAMYSSALQGTPYKFVTLSTCSYPGSGRNTKLLICGVLYKETLANLDTDADADTVEENAVSETTADEGSSNNEEVTTDGQ